MSSETSALPSSTASPLRPARFVARPALWYSLGLAAVAAVHLAAVATIALPSLPSTRSWTGLRDALPTLRLVGTVVGFVAIAGLALLAVTRRARALRAGVGGTTMAALLVIGNLYGCTSEVHVQRRPVQTAAAADGVQTFDHGAFDVVLARFVDEHGMVDYVGLKQERALLDEYVGQLATASPRSNPALFPDADHRMAYWINAYNALMMRAVVDHYPIGSVKDIMVAHGVFSRLYFPVGGQTMTLDDIEKGILLKEFDDPRVHFALTCASMSCPRIDRAAFRAAGLSARLEVEGRDFLRSKDGVQVDVDAGVIRLSSYFKWYGGDFGDDHVAFVRPFLTPAQQAALAQLADASIGHLDYDWRLNDQAASWHAR